MHLACGCNVTDSHRVVQLVQAAGIGRRARRALSQTHPLAPAKDGAGQNAKPGGFINSGSQTVGRRLTVGCHLHMRLDLVFMLTCQSHYVSEHVSDGAAPQSIFIPPNTFSACPHNARSLSLFSCTTHVHLTRASRL